MNGRLLINDSLGNYVNQVADNLLAHDPGLRKQVNIFVVKSPEVNAYTLDNGIILVNIGLLAQLENEAELAYILAHEITHFQERHSMEEYIQSDGMAKSEYAREDYLQNKLSFSRENEIIADTKGLELLMRSNYDPKEAVSALDILKYSYLPFDEVPFDNSFFESDDLKLPATLKLEKLSDISDNESYDDTKSTHPNIKTRRESINSTLRLASDTLTNRKKFAMANRTRFKRLRTIARFETARLYLVSQDYPEAIYTAYLLQKEFPESYYLKQITAKAVYNIAAYKTPGYSERTISGEYSLPDHEKIEGSSQQVFFLFRKMSSQEATTIALSYCWRLKKENPNDKELDKMCENLLYMLAKHHKVKADDFKERVEIKAAEPEAEDTTARELSKYERSRSSKRKPGS